MQRKTAGGGSQSTLQRVNNELLDVHRIMGKNIEQVLNRGENLDGSCVRLAYDALFPSLPVQRAVHFSSVTDVHACPLLYPLRTCNN